MKRCTYCGELKPEAAFYVRRASPDGLSPKCQPCQKIYAKRLYQANPRRAKAQAKSWAEKNPSRRKEIWEASHRRRLEAKRDDRNSQARARRQKNLENAREVGRLAQRKRRDRITASGGLAALRAYENSRLKARRLKNLAHFNLRSQINAARRRARLAKVPGALNRAHVERLFKRAAGRCVYCGKPAKLTLDHVDPIANGGRHGPSNIIPCCHSCNASKQTRPVDEWLHKHHGVMGLARAIVFLQGRRVPEALWAQ